MENETTLCRLYHDRIILKPIFIVSTIFYICPILLSRLDLYRISFDKILTAKNRRIQKGTEPPFPHSRRSDEPRLTSAKQHSFSLSPLSLSTRHSNYEEVRFETRSRARPVKFDSRTRNPPSSRLSTDPRSPAHAPVPLLHVAGCTLTSPHSANKRTGLHTVVHALGKQRAIHGP